jgi:hypothetical protein
MDRHNSELVHHDINYGQLYHRRCWFEARPRRYVIQPIVFPSECNFHSFLMSYDEHVWTGIAREWKSPPLARMSVTGQPALLALKERLYSLDMRWKKVVLYCISFGFILGIAITNPRVRG